MLEQSIEQYLSLEDRPDRDLVIEKDEVLSLIIDIETMNITDFYRKYFS